MTTWANYRKEVYSTPIDCRILSGDFLREFTHSDKIFLDDPRVELALYRSKGLIDMKLGSVMSGTSSFVCTPYISPTLRPAADENGENENTSTSGTLGGVIPAATAITEVWKILFTNATTFTINGSVSGSQGGGLTSALVTSTNSFISIPADSWSGTYAAGDCFYVATYKHIPEIVLLATMLSVGLMYKGTATGASPDAVPEGTKLYYDALKLLDDIASGKASLMGINYTLDTTDLEVAYNINRFGDDTGYYAESELQTANNYNLYPWWYNR